MKSNITRDAAFALLKEPIYVWNQTNMKSVTTIREKVIWGTRTIRHYADTLELYMTYKGRDPIVDKILEDRVKMCEEEVLSKGDRQF